MRGREEPFRHGMIEERDQLIEVAGHVEYAARLAVESELRVVASMHDRKREMADLADAFVALPGGIGTLEELTEVLSWAQLGLHGKPCGVLDVAGYFDQLIAFLDHAVAERFLAPAHRAMLMEASDPDVLLDRLAAYRPPAIEKWLDRN